MNTKKEIQKKNTQLTGPDGHPADKQLIKSLNLFPVVGIGASAGGLDAFKKLLKAIPEDSGMAYVLVQHLDPKHESLLPELLQKVTNIPVLEISDDLRVEPNHIYIIPSNKMMIANDGVLELSPRPAKNRNVRNLPIDLFFISLAEVHQSHAIGVVLSGTASDGTLGLKAIKDHGGITFAQDEESAAYEGMPHSAAQAGVVDFILPPDEIPKKLLEVVGKVNLSDDELQNIPLQEEEVYNQMLTLLRLRKGTDFTYYKQTTIRRRIIRRMAINKNEDHAAYLKYLRENKPEQDILYQDLLIPVTDFFRDPKVFDNLCKTIFPAIIENKTSSEPIRIWVAGCSTGEEVYSMAVCLKELLTEGNTDMGYRAESYQRVQIFATDISEPAIAKARAGVYSKTDVKGLSDKQLKDFFTKTNGIYQANKSIRDMCIFAVHNFLKDPPFSKIDFISCRNVLIYMEPYLQKKALTTFHYALNANGFLLLGKSETTGGVPDLFAAHFKKDKIFTRKDAPGSFIHTTTQRTEESYAGINVKPRRENIHTDFQKTADDIMLSKYTPAGVVINEAMDIVHFRGSTGNYLDPSPGKASLNLLKMAKEGLAFELRNILHKAKKENETAIKENIPVQINNALRNISIEAIPLPNMAEPHYLVLFKETVLTATTKQPTAKAASKIKNDEKDLRIKQLELELAQVRDDMRSISEDQETVNEELQSANEELLSSSEELQSLNEEMETSKEELQSTNEELTVVNQEMIGLNEQVTEARDYAQAIVASVHEPLLVLDKNLRIKSANDAFYKTFQVNERDTAGSLIYELGNKQWNIPALKELLLGILLHKSKFENFEVTHVYPNIGERIMLLNAREMTRDNADEKLILLAIEDITQKKEIENFLIKSTLRFRQLVKDLPAAVYSCDADGLINFYNDAAVKVWGREPALGKEHWCGSFKLFNPDGSPMPLEKCHMALALKEGRAIIGEEVIIERPDGSRSHVLVYPQPEFDLAGKVTGAINMAFDVTEQVQARKKIEETSARYHNMLMNSPFAFSIMKGKDMQVTLANNLIKEIWGKGMDVEGKTLLQVLPELANQPFPAMIDAVYTTGIPVTANEIPALFNYNGITEKKYFNVVYQPHIEADETISGVITIAHEVTDQVLSRRKIEESEERFQAAVAAVQGIVWTNNEKGEMEGEQIGWSLLTGQSYEQYQGYGWANAIHADDAQPTIDAWNEAVRDRKNFVFEHRVKLKNGNWGHFAVKAIPLLNADGLIRQWVGVHTNITLQKQAEDLLKESEHRYHEMVRSSPSLIAILKGKDLIVEIANTAMLESWGKGNIIGQSLFDAVPETVEQGFDKLLLAVYKTGVPVEAYESPVNLLRNGIKEIVYYNFIYQAQRNIDGEIDGVAIIATEVTQQALLNKKIRESEAFNRAVLDSSPDCIKMLDADGRLQFMNTNGLCLLEIDDFKTVENTYWWDMWEPANQQIIKDAVTTAKSGEKIQLQLFSATAKGTLKWWDVIVLPIMLDGKNEKIQQVLSVSRDITEYKDAALKVKESEEQLQSIFGQAPAAICVLDGPEHTYVLANAAYQNMISRNEEQLIGKTIKEVFPHLQASGAFEILDNVFKTGEPFIAPEFETIIDRFNDGILHTTYYNFNLKPLKIKGKVTSLMVVAYDITEQIEARKKIEQSETKFRTLIKDAPVATCFFTGREMTIEVANELMIGYWGKGKNVIGKKLADAVPELIGQPFLQILDQVFTTGKTHEAKNEYAQLKLDGVLGEYYFDYTYKPIRNAAGQVYGIMNMAVDVTEQVLARRKIEESEKQFRQMAELMPQKIWTSDAAGNKNYFNKTLLDYAGFSLEELKGSGWQQIVHPDDWGKNKTQWEECIKTGKNYETENRLLRKDGKFFWHLTRAVAIKDEDGKIKTWVGSKTEIQEQKQQKQELEKAVTKRTQQLLEVNKELEQKNEEIIVANQKLLTEYSRSLIEASLDPLVTINIQGKVTDMNQATVDITGVSRAQLTGTNFLEYFTEPQKARQVYEQVFAKGSVVNSPLTLRHTDGKLTDVFLNGSVYKDDKGKVLGVVLVARDVTEEKIVATKLTEAIIFAELATGMAEEAKGKAEDATKIAEDAVKAKQQFLSNMSHEIRTPMNAIIGFTKVVLKTELTDKQREYLTAIKLSGNSLIVLINDILDLAKVDAGKMTFEEIPFKMSASIAAMIHLFETKVQEKNVELVKIYDDKIPEVLLGDPVRLHQIILNLVSNAVKFTSKGKITVSLQLVQDDEESVSIEFKVADTGTGIPESKIEDIFKKFHQASSETSRLYGGTGLGLAIVKQLVEAQNGTITVKSKLNEGSAFSFTLSFKKTIESLLAETEILEIGTENKNIKVLVVEDIALNQLLMKTLLDDFGFERDIAANGKIAIEKLQQKNYDIILMDLQMPEMNGFEATDYIRNKLNLKIPIIALTADVTTVDLEKCKAVGMNDYIAKPVDERILYSKIVGLVKNRDKKKYPITAKAPLAAAKNKRCTDLAYLISITRYNRKLIMEMIALYLKQTPPLISALKISMQQKNLEQLHAAAHKLIPSFAIMGIGKEYEMIAKKVQEYQGSLHQATTIEGLVMQLVNICTQACAELEEEYTILKNTTA